MENSICLKRVNIFVFLLLQSGHNCLTVEMVGVTIISESQTCLSASFFNVLKFGVCALGGYFDPPYEAKK